MEDDAIQGVILEEDIELSLGELAEVCVVHADWLVTLVEEGILEPSGRSVSEWRFSGVCLHRARAAQRLQRDLGLNLPGVAVVLDLLEELDELRVAMDTLKRFP